MAEHLTLSQMQAELRQSQQALLALLDKADDDTLYQRPAADEWTLAENLVHVAEARSFFTAETRKVLATPGVSMGRTIADHDRIENVRTHGHDSRSTIHNKLVTSHEQLLDLLQQMSEEDLQKTGVHVKYGPQPLAEFIDHFIVEHDQAHVKQTTALLS